MDGTYLFKDLHYGRQRIVLDYDEVTPDNLWDVMKKVLSIHGQNSRDCEYLINYFLGKQDILNRMGNTTSNINNTVVVNRAFPITREIVGYTYGQPVDVTSRNGNFDDEIEKLSKYYNYENGYYVDICSNIFASVCGVGYQMTLPSSDIKQDYTPDVPIIYTYLDPRYTFVVKNNRPGDKTILSGYYTINSVTKKRDYICYTDDYKFEFSNMDMETLNVSVNPIGRNPITMIENSIYLTGDWEEAISVMNAENQVASDSLNDIEGTIKSLLVIIGAELEEDGESLKGIKNKRLLTLTRGTGDNSNLDAKFIAPQLDSTSVANMRKYLEDARNVITGIPDRAANSSGGDTGVAVINRDGWTDIEIVAKLKELFFKKAKQEQLGVGIKILKMLDLIDGDLSELDMQLTIGRNNYDNLQTKTQAFSTLVATNRIATIDALRMSNLTNTPREIVERGKMEQKENENNNIETQKTSDTDEDIENNINSQKQ